MDFELLKYLLVFFPVPVIYLAYFRYFQRKPGYLYHLESFLYGTILAIILLLLNGIIEFFYPVPLFALHSNIFNGFVKAALPEKIGATILIYYLIRKNRGKIVVIDSMIMAMLLGSGFSAIENWAYSTSSSASVILVRFLSAVPLHTYTCGMIGYFLSMMAIGSSSIRKKQYLIYAFILPYLLHGLFDSLILVGGPVSYFIGPMLVLMNALIVYLFAKGQTYPPEDWLSDMELHFEDWVAIHREPQYERWILRSMGSEATEYVSFFDWGIDFRKIFLALLIGGAAGSILYFHEPIFSYLKIKLTFYEEATLFVALPLAYILNILTVGIVNPEYFRRSIIRIPIIADVEYTVDGKRENSITYDITPSTSFIRTIDDIPVGTPIKVKFTFSNRQSPEVDAVVIWDNHSDPNQSAGTTIRILDRSRAFRKFLRRYHRFKFSRGLAFNLKIPGFEMIRRLFVQPLSVMQVEKKYRAGTLIFQEGDEGNEFYYVKKGEVEIFKQLSTGERVVMTVQTKGQIFGEMAIVGKQSRSAGAICKTDCVLSVAAPENLRALIKGNPEFALRIIDVFAKRLYSSEKILKDNIESIKESYENREKFMFMALDLMLVGFGFEIRNNEIFIKTNLPRILEVTGFDIDTVIYLFRILSRRKNLDELNERLPKMKINTEFLKQTKNLHLNIELGDWDVNR